MGRFLQKGERPAGAERPVLDLSGPRLTAAFEALVEGGEEAGGVERLVAGVASKAALFRRILGEGRAHAAGYAELLGLAAFMAPVRRRIGAFLAANGYAPLQDALARLLDGEAAGVDERMARFSALFPEDRRHRWVRDLAAEALHFTDPERYPLMTRWVWDRRANTGALREMWYGEDVDRMTIDVPDTYPTFLMLREELAQFLSANGVFRDVHFYVDLLLAKVYGEYVSTQGGAYLRTDFSQPDDPLVHTRRLLGLDGVDVDLGKTRVKLAEGHRHVPGEPTARG